MTTYLVLVIVGLMFLIYALMWLIVLDDARRDDERRGKR
jgi:hypothetical protein